MAQQFSMQGRIVTGYNSSLNNTYAPYLLNHARAISDTHHAEPSSGVKTLHMSLLGGFALQVNDVPVSGLDVQRLQALLAFLALHRGLSQARSCIAYTLWPDSTDAQARTNLRNLLFKLRLALPEVESFLVVERQTLCWQPATDWGLDVMEFERAVMQAEQARCAQDVATELQALEEAIRLYQGDLLPTCYDEWICGERERLQQLYQGALERLLELLEQVGNYTGAIRIAQRLLRLDPLQEATYRHLMRLYAARGDRSSVLRIYQACTAVLKSELGIEPGLTTRRAFERFMRAADEPAVTSSVR